MGGVLGEASFLFAPSAPVAASTVSPVNGSPIQHIVIIMQENRSFDNLFNGFPGADTVTTGMSAGKTIPLQPIALGDPRDLNHSQSSGGRIGTRATWMALRKMARCPTPTCGRAT